MSSNLIIHERDAAGIQQRFVIARAAVSALVARQEAVDCYRISVLLRNGGDIAIRASCAGWTRLITDTFGTDVVYFEWFYDGTTRHAHFRASEVDGVFRESRDGRPATTLAVMRHATVVMNLSDEEFGRLELIVAANAAADELF